jgi:hypothetical protein
VRVWSQSVCTIFFDFTQCREFVKTRSVSLANEENSAAANVGKAHRMDLQSTHNRSHYSNRSLKKPCLIQSLKSEIVRGQGLRAAWVLVMAFGLLMARGGEYLIKTWDADGLIESAVTDVAQSEEGYIWAGTPTHGFSRFNGVRFANFDSDDAPQLAARGVRRLAAGPDGTMWINGFGNCLARWSAAAFRLEYSGSAVNRPYDGDRVGLETDAMKRNQ